MRLIIDKDIPFIEGVFEPFAEVVYEKGSAINKALVKEADALIIRTRTKCNKELLEGSAVKMIASATIGKDHVDLGYCAAHGIRFINAAGCNAGGVMQYVFTALYAVAVKKGLKLPVSGEKKMVLGIIGVGNVGTKVAELGEYLGFEVLRNDPAKEREQTLAFNNGYLQLTDFKDYYSLEYLLEHSDIITVHVYLDEKTQGMVNMPFLQQAKSGVIFINSSRGEVVDEQALLLAKDKLSALILDVWDQEPDINRKLLVAADIATPHIAGYSYEGKLNGTQMVVRGVADFFGIEKLKNFTITPDTPNINHLTLKNLSEEKIYEKLNDIFPIFEQSKVLRESPADFEKIRSDYKYRREFYVNYQ
ncbi:MAG: 4-phosphoerythronate dehydrogenase [Bacteroidales bacterium]